MSQPEPLGEPLWTNTLLAMQELLNRDVEISIYGNSATHMVAAMSGRLGGSETWDDDEDGLEVHAFGVGDDDAALYLSEGDLTEACWDGSALTLTTGEISITIQA